jgi:hypothetical protein
MVAHHDWLPTFLAMAGDPEVTNKLSKGYTIGDLTYKVHLDGHNLVPYLTGETQKSPRVSFIYCNMTSSSWRCATTIGSWYSPNSGSPAQAKTPHGARLLLLSPPLQHAAVELLRGTMAKHNFIAYRVDRPGASRPIEFESDAWRGWVPLRLPWTLCIRDRAPPGFAAVLINRAHTYPDLALPIDAEEEQIFAAIAGDRSVDEILRGAAGAVGCERGRRFIERLWEYDQIVVDAISAP